MGAALIALAWTLLAPLPTVQGPAVDVTGAWVLTVETSMGVSSPTINVQQEGDRLSGVYVSRYGDFPVSGSVKNRAIQFSIKMRGGEVTIAYRGEVSADSGSMKGTADLADIGEATWTARRAK